MPYQAIEWFYDNVLEDSDFDKGEEHVKNKIAQNDPKNAIGSMGGWEKVKNLLYEPDTGKDKHSTYPRKYTETFQQKLTAFEGITRSNEIVAEINRADTQRDLQKTSDEIDLLPASRRDRAIRAFNERSNQLAEQENRRIAQIEREISNLTTIQQVDNYRIDPTVNDVPQLDALARRRRQLAT